MKQSTTDPTKAALLFLLICLLELLRLALRTLFCELRICYRSTLSLTRIQIVPFADFYGMLGLKASFWIVHHNLKRKLVLFDYLL